MQNLEFRRVANLFDQDKFIFKRRKKRVAVLDLAS